jgi:hypothetical protein
VAALGSVSATVQADKNILQQSFMLSTPAIFQKGKCRAWRRTMANKGE